MTRRFDLSAIAALRAALRADRAGEARRAVGPHGDSAAVAFARRVRGDGRATDDCALCMRERALPVQAATDLNRAATGIARRIDLRAIGDIDRAAGDVDRAAGLTLCRSGCVERSAVVDRAIGAGIEIDFAIVRRNRRGLDHAGIVDDVVLDVARRARRHHHLAARGQYLSGIGDERCRDVAILIARRIGDRRGDFVAQQIVAGHIDRERLGAAKHYCSNVGADQAFIGDARRRQDHGTVRAGRDRAFVDDRGIRIAGRFEVVISRLEIIVAEVGGRREESADIDLGTLAEQHAVRVDQPDIAVREKLAIDG